MTEKQLIKKYPDIAVHEYNNGAGVRYELYGRKITFWYKRNKVHYSHNNDWQKFKTGEEIRLVENYLIVQNTGTAMTPVQPMPQQVKQEPKVIFKHSDDKGTQACIEHIARKKAAVEKVKGSNEVGCMLAQLMGELKQYL